MASKKTSARDRADQFLAAIGTAGGPIGAPGLVNFGAGDMLRQLESGNTDQYASIRMMGGGPVVGDPNATQPRMPQDLDASYLKLNLPGSPLPRNGLLSPQFQQAAESIQNQLINQEQYAMIPMMPPTGQLPMGIQPPMPQKKGGR